MTIDENTKNNSKEKPISDMFNEFDEKLQSRLLEQESKIAEKINSLSKSSVSSSQKSQTEDEIWNAASDDDEEIITKKDLKKYLNDFENKAQKLAETLVETKLAEVTTKAGRDQQAFMEFPLLNPQSSHFSKEFTEAVKREIDAMNKYKIQDLVDYRFPELKRIYAQLIEKTSQASYYLIDGNHRAVAAALTHNPIYAIELQNDKDLNKVRKMVKCGELFEFNRDETSLQELVLEFDDYLLNNIEDCMTIQQRVDKLTSNGDLPEYIKIKYLENRI